MCRRTSFHAHRPRAGNARSLPPPSPRTQLEYQKKRWLNRWCGQKASGIGRGFSPLAYACGCLDAANGVKPSNSSSVRGSGTKMGLGSAPSPPCTDFCYTRCSPECRHTSFFPSTFPFLPTCETQTPRVLACSCRPMAVP